MCWTKVSQIKNHQHCFAFYFPGSPWARLCSAGLTSTVQTMKTLSKALNMDSRQPHKCLICGKGFLKLKYMKTHMLIHRQLKPYACNLCSSQFNFRSCLERHKKFHLRQCQFMCRRCGKKFVQKSDCHRHEKIHGLLPCEPVKHQNAKSLMD